MPKRDRAGVPIHTPIGIGAGAAAAIRYFVGPRNMPRTRGPLQVTDANAQQYHRSKYKLGKKKRLSLQKLVRNNKSYSIYRYQGLTSLDTAGGYFPCNTNQAGGTGPVLWPLHIFDLTNAPNLLFDGTSNNVVSDLMHFRAVTPGTDPTSNIVFEATRASQNQDGTGVVPGVWLYEKAVGGPTVFNNVPEFGNVLEWVQFKLMLYGTLTRPVRWRVELIQLRYDWLHPDFFVRTSTDPGTLNPDYLQQRNAFWQYMLKPYTTTPLNTQATFNKGLYTVVKTLCDTIIEPKLSTEPNAQATTWPNTGGTPLPHQKELNVFYRMNRKVRYDWNDNDGVNMATSNLGWQQNLGECQTSVAPRARMYLMIRATAPVNNTGAQPSAAVLSDPTFDIMIRKKHAKLK